MRKINIGTVFSNFKKTNSHACSFMRDIINSYPSEIQPFLIIRTLEWRWRPIDNNFGAVELEYSTWSPGYGHIISLCSEVSFKDADSEQTFLDKLEKHFEKALNENKVFTDSFECNKSKVSSRNVKLSDS